MEDLGIIGSKTKCRLLLSDHPFMDCGRFATGFLDFRAAWIFAYKFLVRNASSTSSPNPTTRQCHDHEHKPIAVRPRTGVAIADGPGHLRVVEYLGEEAGEEEGAEWEV